MGKCRRDIVLESHSHCWFSQRLTVIPLVRLYALRVLRHRGMTEIGLHAAFRAVVVSRLTYVSPAWSGFTTRTDRQRVDALLSRSMRCGFCPPELPDFDQLLQEADDQLFERILNNPQHTLYQLLPPQSAASQKYSLRPRKHDRQLSV